MYLSICLSIYLSIYISIYLSIDRLIDQSFDWSIHLSTYLSIYFLHTTCFSGCHHIGFMATVALGHIHEYGCSQVHQLCINFVVIVIGRACFIEIIDVYLLNMVSDIEGGAFKKMRYYINSFGKIDFVGSIFQLGTCSMDHQAFT